MENIIHSLANFLRKNIQYSQSLEEMETTDDSIQRDESSHTALIVGLIIGFVLFVILIVFLLIYLKKRFSEDMDRFQFKGMLSKGYWLNKDERLRPISVSPIHAAGGAYEPCSIEETEETVDDYNDNDSGADHMPDPSIRRKTTELSHRSTSSDDEKLYVIEQNGNNQDTRRQETPADHQLGAKSHSRV